MDKPLTQDEDQKIWCPNLKGEFTTTSAYEDIRSKKSKVSWHKVLWSARIHPSTAANAWKLMRNFTATNSGKNFREEGCSWYQDVEFVRRMLKNLNHLLWYCPFARQLWEWISSKFRFKNGFSSLTQARRMAQGSSVVVRHMWEAAVVGGMVALWFHRNKVHFEDESNNFAFCTKYVKQQVNCAIHTSNGTMYGTAHDYFVRLAWGAELKLRKAPQIKECKWLLPEIDQVKVNVDGSFMGNPGPTRWDATYRDHNNSEFLLMSCKGLGVETNYVVECYAILENAEVTIEKG
ncbi:hypothetical protein IFM89_031461 [Coptis chinensis]|uniref:Reverse transcriptase zinc-binding domain-containing protein n=1 Tax=Coptis chinensis TaxID=261450 RepID=A0A835LKC4_9MAGN|nr:hypothetical protein IFM89_031461 [Coptis chinensis]